MKELTRRRSPTSRVFFMEPLGMLLFWKIQVRAKRTKMRTTQMVSQYSRTTPLAGTPGSCCVSSFTLALAMGNLFQGGLPEDRNGLLRSGDPYRSL